MQNDLARPKILISACLEFNKCRYDGSVVPSTLIEKLVEYVDFIEVCPEVGIGLPIPREAVRLIQKGDSIRFVESYSGTDHTEEMDAFIDTFFKSLKTPIDGVIMKCKSPTCGLKDAKTYPGVGKMGANPGKTEGYFGRVVSEKFKGIPVEDDGRLKHFNIREQFLMSIFIQAEFREVSDRVKSTGKLKALVEFHTRHKYLFMAYQQKTLTEMGRVLANHDHLSLEDVLSQYGALLPFIYNAAPSHGKNTNMLLHLFGYFKKDLSDHEKAFFLDQLALYQNRKIPFSTVLMLIKAWVIRFDEPYLKTQRIFDLFPVELIELTDSGKGLP